MIRTFSLMLLASTALVSAAAHAQDLPHGGTVAAGAATIATPTPNAMTISQSSDRAIINWQAFSIAQGNRVDVAQPNAQSVLLNRVTSDASSTIAGALNANGQVYLVNPNGIFITKTGSVNAAGFVASTLDIDDDRFMQGEVVVTGKGGRVANHGNIAIVKGGYAALIGGQVDNTGLIVAPLGKVALGAGTRATLDFNGDGFLQVALPQAAGDTGITMSGRIAADGGSVVLSAASALDAARHVVNLSGVIEARGVCGRSGAVTLTGPTIALTGATVDVSGVGSGAAGTVRIGGDRMGSGNLAHAATLSVDAASAIRADAGAAGNGGDVVLWSDRATRFAGTISAKGAGGGNGGEAEVSSAGLLDYTGTTDLTGARFGNLLLDPYNITISSGTDANHSGFTATGDDSVINAATLQQALGTANVTVSTGSSGSQAGDITLASDLGWASNGTLTLQAAGGITLNGKVTAAAGGLTLDAGGTIVSTADLSVASFDLQRGQWVQNSATLPGFAAGDFRVATTGASFLRATGGTGDTTAPYLLSDIYGVQGINGFLNSNFALANDIAAAGTASWNGGAGFVPLGTDGAGKVLNNNIGFTGVFDGQGHVITGLTISRQNADYVGLFGRQGGGTISRVGMLGGSVTGRHYVGGLVANLRSGTISQSYATGAVTGMGEVVGGLVGGQDAGTISQSYATGAVSGSGYSGGLVGQRNSGAISQSYATGAVSGSDYLGGLVGYQYDGTISQSYATGAVSGTTYSGGLVGYLHQGTVEKSYWDSHTTGQIKGAGNLGTLSGAKALTSAGGAGDTAYDQSKYVGFDFTNDWVMPGNGTRPFLRWEVPVAVGGVYTITNSHQLQLINAANLAGSYVLAKDIDLTADLAAVGGKYSGMWSSAGFVPLGTNGAGNLLNWNGFTGVFDGQSHVITGLTITRPSASYVGLFGWQGGGTIERVGVVGGSIQGDRDVGGLVGSQSRGTISQSYATGAVSGSDYLGGLVGSQDYGEISQSYATGAVSGSDYLGGLVGIQYFGTINQSYATGAVSGSDYLGGLVGSQDYGAISQSYATGAVSGSDYLGGLVGSQDYGEISQSYATGAVSGSNNSGGLVGAQYGGSVTDSYWDSHTTGQTSGAGNSPTLFGATALSSASGAGYTAYIQSKYVGFDFTSGWVMPGNDTRPFLRWEAPVAVNGVYTITNSHQLQLINVADLAGSYVLAKDIDLTADLAAVGGKYSGMWSSAGFVPLGIDGAGNLLNGGNGFTGTFDGHGHVITGLTITRPSADYVGLFGWQGGGTIARVGVVGGSIRGHWVVGGLVGYQYGAISQSYATGAVSGSVILGGLVGFQDHSTISQSYATGAVSGSADTGGLVGYQSGGTVTASYWDTDTTRQTTSAGSGAIGRTTAEMQDLANFATNYAGWDFTSVWAPPNQAGQNNQSSTAYYPELYALSRVVSVTPTSGTAVYGDAITPTIQYYGLRAGDTITTPATIAGVPATSDVGSHIRSASGAAASDPAYRFVYTPATYTVTPRALSVTANALSRGYDGTAFNGGNGVAYSGFVNGQDASVLSGAVSYGGASQGAIGAGVYAITASGLSATNYAITYVDGKLTVTPRALSITADALSRSYGDANPALTYSPIGLVAGDKLTGTLTTSATATSNVGNYAIGQGSLAATANYVLSYTGADLSITPRALSVTATALSRSYGAANPGLTYSVTGLVNGDTLGGALTTGATATSNVGNYAIGQGSLAASANYALSYTGANLAVTRRALSVAANDTSRSYDGTAFTGGNGVTYSGFVNGQDASVLSGAVRYGGASQGAIDAGVYAITASGLSATNYAITYVDGKLTVTPRALSVTAAALSRSYGDANPALTYSHTGLVAGDTLTGALTTGATATSNVGEYAIGQGSLAASANYVLSYTGANLTITPAALTATYVATPGSSIYGDVPVLVGTVTATGLKGNDTLADLVTGVVSWTSTGGSTSGVGTYGVTGGGLVAGTRNYAISFAQDASNASALTITPRALSVAANPLSRSYGDANPVLTYNPTGLVNGDTLGGALTTSATATSNVGNYAIGQGSLAASANYALSYTVGNLTVTPRALNVAANPLRRIYGDTNPTLTYSANGLVNGDTLTGVLATDALQFSLPGLYAITQGSLGASANYAVRYTGANLTIIPPATTVASDIVRDAFRPSVDPARNSADVQRSVDGDRTGAAGASSETTPGASCLLHSDGTNTCVAGSQ